MRKILIQLQLLLKWMDWSPKVVMKHPTIYSLRNPPIGSQYSNWLVKDILANSLYNTAACHCKIYAINLGNLLILLRLKSQCNIQYCNRRYRLHISTFGSFLNYHTGKPLCTWFKMETEAVANSMKYIIHYLFKKN